MRSVKRARRPLSLREKLISSYLLLILLPMTLLGSFAFVRIEGLLLQQHSAAYLETVRQTALNIRTALETYEIPARVVCRNQTLLSTLRTLRVRTLTAGEEYDHYQRIRGIKDAALVQDGVEQVRLAVAGTATFISPLFEIFPLRDLLADAAFANWPRGEGQRWMLSKDFDTVRVSDPTSYQLCMRIVDYYDQNALLGYLLVEVSPDTLFASMETLRLPEGARLLLHDGRRVLRHTGAGDPSDIHALALLTETSAGSVETLDGRSHLVLQTEVGGQNWRLALCIPKSLLLRSGVGLPLTILVLALVLSACAVLFAVLLTHGLNKRLQEVLACIRRLEGGELGATMPVRVHDEYGQIQSALNRMSGRIKALITDLMDTQAKQKRAELRLLYEQINPHFVYNTLDVIRWEALRNHAPPLAELADTLVGYLRRSLNHGQEFIAVEDEADMIVKYIQIMNHRYNNSIQLAVDIAPDIRQISIPKMVLQPLVENAVLHGVMGKPERSGCIRVQGWREEDALLLSVADDGTGMTEDQISGLLRPGGTHYGLWNVQERLQAHYGPESGLRFKSAHGQGCTVTIRIRLPSAKSGPAAT